MPAMLDDPTAPVIYRTSGDLPYPGPFSPLPSNILPRKVTLRDRITAATIIPFSSPDQVPLSLLSYLCDQLNKEIEKGDTYPMITQMPLESFGPYWFANFGAVMLLGDIENAEQVRQMETPGRDWEKECLGSFYIKPNYPGRSSHVCNGGFLVTDGARNRGVGRLMGECYIDWAPKLGYSYSVFNLVYETNVASCRIWDALGFKRIGRVKGCGNLRSYPDQLIDAIIYGRELGTESDEPVSEERFDKIKYYLKHGKYPNGADRAEKSRLRSAATHYKLIPATDTEPEKLMLKGKEVIADPLKQYEIARAVHCQQHGGINKTTATIAEKYHWVRIKETVSAAIRNCHECKDPNRPPPVRPDSSGSRRSNSAGAQQASELSREPSVPRQEYKYDAQPAPIAPQPAPGNIQPAPSAPQHVFQGLTHSDPSLPSDSVPTYDGFPPVDPRIMEGVEQTLELTSRQPVVPFPQGSATGNWPARLPDGRDTFSQLLPHPNSSLRRGNPSSSAPQQLMPLQDGIGLDGHRGPAPVAQMHPGVGAFSQSSVAGHVSTPSDQQLASHLAKATIPRKGT